MSGRPALKRGAVAGVVTPWDPPGWFRALLVVVLLYTFLLGVALLESGISALGSGFQEGLLASVANPLSGLFAGILATVLVQSSSVSTSTIVGLVGAGTLPVSLAVPMIMGANIGTTVTNTLASLGSIRRSEEFRRGFAAATVHDFFNIIAVVVILPIQLWTGFLTIGAEFLTELFRGADFDPGAPGRSPIRTAVRVPVGTLSDLLGDGLFPALLLLATGLGLIFFALAFITKNMRRLVAGGVERTMNRMIGRGGGLTGILLGIIVTIAVQSSTITTSILVPLVAAGVLTLRNAYPITVGANVGTTMTALLASLAVMRPEGLTIALVHTLFNLSAIAIIFPVPLMRSIPVVLAERIAGMAVRRHSLVFAYVVGLFLVLPVLGIFLLN
jgi:solute carrier family 34 (sodium-dependent phosphate cotransporter)